MSRTVVNRAGASDRSLLLIALAAVALVGGSSSATRAATLCVDNTGVCSDVSGTPCYCTIQAAINAASNGDTITVAASTYTVAGLVTGDKTLTLLSANTRTPILPALRWGRSSAWRLPEFARVADGRIVYDRGATPSLPLDDGPDATRGGRARRR